MPGFGGKPSDSRGSTPKKQDSNFACRRPFSQLGNPHALGVSVLRPSEIGGEVRKDLTVFGGKSSDLRGMTLKKQDSNFAFRGPVSQLGNPHALGMSDLQPSESCGGDHKFFPVLESNCLI